MFSAGPDVVQPGPNPATVAVAHVPTKITRSATVQDVRYIATNGSRKGRLTAGPFRARTASLCSASLALVVKSTHRIGTPVFRASTTQYALVCASAFVLSASADYHPTLIMYTLLHQDRSLASDADSPITTGVPSSKNACATLRHRSRYCFVSPGTSAHTCLSMAAPLTAERDH